MPETRTSRDRWIAEGLRALGVGGPDAVRVEKLARALGVTKGGFYGHFSDRAALLAEMLDVWERVSVDETIRIIDAQPGDGRAKLTALFALVTAASEMLGVELAIRNWARREPAVTARLARIDHRRMDYMRSLFASFCTDPDDVEARCLTAFALYVGTHFIVGEHGNRTRGDVLRRALDRLLE